MTGQKRKLPVILPEEMEHESKELNEQIILTEFSLQNLRVAELEPLAPPHFSLKSAYQDKNWVVYNLVAMTIALAN